MGSVQCVMFLYFSDEIVCIEVSGPLLAFTGSQRKCRQLHRTEPSSVRSPVDVRGRQVVKWVIRSTRCGVWLLRASESAAFVEFIIVIFTFSALIFKRDYPHTSHACMR